MKQLTQQQIQDSVQKTLQNQNITNTASVKQVGSSGVIILPKKANTQKKDPALYRFRNLNNQTLVKLPGQIAGEQFVIENCKNCNIYLLDYSNTVYIDDCTDCRIYVGPVESSVFIRDCYRCKFIIACGQFRTRQCNDLSILLMCQSQPIIESSLRMGFGCFRAAYPELLMQMKKAKIDPWNNTWSDIFDFTPQYKPQENHFYMLSDDLLFDDILPPASTVYDRLTPQYENQLSNQVVPFTYESREKYFCRQALFIFYPRFSFENDINRLIKLFQPLPNQQQMILVEDEQDPDEVIIDAPETLPYFLVKAKNSFLFPENYLAFKDLIYQATPKAQQLMNQLVVNDHVQRLFSLLMRTDDEDVDLISYMRSIISTNFDDAAMDTAVITITNTEHVEELSRLVFANMADEKGDKPPNK